MKVLYEEIINRFPECALISGVDDFDEDNYDYLSFLALRKMIDWVSAFPSSDKNPELISRISKFKEWCENQQSGDSAENDIYTMFIVNFYEELFKENSTRILIPFLTDRDELIHNQEYLKDWVGEDNFNKTLMLFKVNTI